MILYILALGLILFIVAVGLTYLYDQKHVLLSKMEENRKENAKIKADKQAAFDKLNQDIAAAKGKISDVTFKRNMSDMHERSMRDTERLFGAPRPQPLNPHQRVIMPGSIKTGFHKPNDPPQMDLSKIVTVQDLIDHIEELKKKIGTKE